MAEEKRPSRNLIGKAIRSERQSTGEVDLDNLKDTLAKSSLWKTNTLQRIEDTRSGQKLQEHGASQSKDAVLQSLKRSLLQLVDQHWSQLATSSNGDATPADQRTALILDDADTQRCDTKLQNEYNGMRKALAVQVKEVIKVRRRLRKQEKKAKHRNEKISQLQETVADLKAENGRLSKQHERAISELQAENSSLKDHHERAIAELQAENASLMERHTEAMYGQQRRLVELQDAYDQFQQQSDQLLNELDRENALLRAGEKPANDDAQFAPFDVNAQ